MRFHKNPTITIIDNIVSFSINFCVKFQIPSGNVAILYILHLLFRVLEFLKTCIVQKLL